MDTIATSALEKKADSVRQIKIITKYKVCELSISNPDCVPEYVYHTISYVRSQREDILGTPHKGGKQGSPNMIK